VGGVHIAQALVTFAETLDFEPIIVDPREAWANPQRFPTVSILSAWPDEAFHDGLLDSGSAVVALTHDPKFDDPAIIRGLHSDAFYVGALGGRQSNQKRSDRLRKHGLPDALIQRVHAPIGLDIGATNPQEIALAIMAEIVSLWHRR
jgi:xanthine dehydrogenase accessory factor